MLHGLARTLARVWLATSTNSWRRLPRPTDAPIVHAPGVTPDRVLFIGSGAVVGYGVLLHKLSISGEIARQASQVTDRGMDADIIAAPTLDIAAARVALRDVRIARYDAIVLMLGPIEAMNLYPLTQWRRNLTQLLEWLAAEAPASLQILVVGVPPFERIVTPPLLGVFAKHCQAINRITGSVVEGRRHVTFVPFEPDAEDFVAKASHSLHVAWASLIVPSLVAALSSDAPVRAEVVDEGARLAALLRLNLLDSAQDDNIQDLVDAARGMLDASGASFNLIDRDRHWVKAAAGLSREPVQMPRS
ncbi:MAG: hypothetical protein H7226_02090, partial [Salinibacterium sp.]|nr:hypothetical protein [Salinibacterium sp.]